MGEKIQFTQKVVDFLLNFLKHQNRITKTETKLDGVRYYFMTSYLKGHGLIMENGVEKTKKVWSLTPKGLKVAKLLKQINEMVEENA